MSNTAFEALKEFMVQNYGAKVASGGREIVKRCHICGDSRDQSSRHMYIGLKPNGAIVYNCFKCNSSGMVDGKFFRDLGCFNVDMINICNQNNSKVSPETNSNRSYFYKNRSPILTYREDSGSLNKLAYINNRLGTNFNFDDLRSLKIVLNLYDYLNANGQPKLTRYKDIADQLDQYFLGFLSVDNAFLNMRRLVPKEQVSKYIHERYVNYNVYGLYDNRFRYYIIPGDIDMMRPLRINIAEGPFDILGVKFNTEAGFKTNSIFASIGGKSYINLVKFFLMEYGLINFELHVYVDNDVDNYEVEKIHRLLYPYGNPVYIHRNTFPGGKDYGVAKDHINDSIIKL